MKRSKTYYTYKDKHGDEEDYISKLDEFTCNLRGLTFVRSYEEEVDKDLPTVVYKGEGWTKGGIETWDAKDVVA